MNVKEFLFRCFPLQINSEMLRSLVLTGVNPVISIESEAFGLSHYKAKRYSVLISASLVEMGSQESCGCLLRKRSSFSNRCVHLVVNYSFYLSFVVLVREQLWFIVRNLVCSMDQCFGGGVD